MGAIIPMDVFEQAGVIAGDPARLGWPATLPIEIALKTAPLARIKDEYGYSDEEWEALRHDPVFLADLAQAVETVKQDGMSFKLKAKLQSRTTLVLGNLKDTVPEFVSRHSPPPIGFVAVDVDLYSSTRDALALLAAPDTQMLWHMPIYLDDIDFIFNHRFAGELLALDEFNRHSDRVKVDRWYGLRNDRPFPERPYLDKLFVAHDLEGTSTAVLTRERGVLSIKA